jgi:hypothetical protein
MLRSCKVIATCFAGREVRLENASCGDPPGLFMHAQNFPDSESVLGLMALVRELESKVDPGIECDTIVVNNDVGWRKGNNYLDSIQGSRTFSGLLKVVHRENFGSSLGAYHHAYEMFRAHYDYWTFTEDDILINGNRWLALCVSAFEQHDNTGFVAIQGLSDSYALHAHGGVGLTHVSILDAVQGAWGALPHRLRNESQSDDDHMVFGEVLFTNIIKRLGFRLVTVESVEPLYEFAYDYMMRERGHRVRTHRPGLIPRLLRKTSRVTEAWATLIEKKPR